jgi:LemA protein
LVEALRAGPEREADGEGYSRDFGAPHDGMRMPGGKWMKATGAVVGIIILAVVVLGSVGWYVSGLNKAVRLHETCNEKWAQVETMIQRRNDLIPNLVSSVSGYMTFEKGTLEEITRLRSQWSQASTLEQKIDNAQAMDAALGRLMVVVENYPELKASENFQTLMAELEGTENRIATERVRYNDAVRAFNTYQREVFGKFFTKRRGLTEPMPYFEAAPGAEKVPEVKF